MIKKRQTNIIDLKVYLHSNTIFMCVVVGRFEEEELGQKIKAETIYMFVFFIEANCIDWDIAVGFVGDCFFQLIRTLNTDILILFPNKDVIERLNYVINRQKSFL